MRESTWVSLLLLLLLPTPQRGGPQDGRRSPEPEPERGPLQPFDLLYASGVAAYYSGDYERAVRDLEAALSSHRRLRDIRTRCARHCAARRPLAPPGAGPGAELPFFRAVLERARCSRSCQSQRLGGPASRHRVSEDVRSDFQRRVPYNYLQRAYIKLNQLEKAMEAAHTFFMANPEHMEMQQDLEDYKATARVEAPLLDREAKPHLESYNAGVKHYEADDFESAIKYFEQALREYFNEDMECRALCEGPQRFEEYEYLGYKGGLYEAIAGSGLSA